MKIGLPSPQFKHWGLCLSLLCGFVLLSSFGNKEGGGGKNPGQGTETTTAIIRQRLLANRLASGDPLYFMLSANKKYVKQGEEVEFTISAHFIEDTHKTFIVDRELYGYKLRLTMPEGFVVTGGTFHDLLQDRVSKPSPSKSYTLKGYFENECES